LATTHIEKAKDNALGSWVKTKKGLPLNDDRDQD